LLFRERKINEGDVYKSLKVTPLADDSIQGKHSPGPVPSVASAHFLSPCQFSDQRISGQLAHVIGSPLKNTSFGSCGILTL
jgi:hypothetical protein